MPGFGSLMARRIAGYFQAPLCVLGLVLTLAFGARFVLWYFANRARLNDPQTDPLAVLAELWINVRWALLGMAVFALDWLWAGGTSLSLLAQAKRQEAALRNSPRADFASEGEPRTPDAPAPTAGDAAPRRPPKL